MKKVKVKTKQKQKQKQSQTVNINLGNVLKKSQPRRKAQPKQHNISQPISFNAPPIREYIDTSLSNQVSRLDNPLLARTTITNPIVEGSSPPVNVVGQIQNKFPLFQAQKKEVSITDQQPKQLGLTYNSVDFNAAMEQDLMDMDENEMNNLMTNLPGYDISRNINNRNRNQINQSEQQLEKIKKAEQAKYEKKLKEKIKKENAIRKKEEADKNREENKRINEAKKAEKIRLNEEKKAETIRLNEEKKAETIRLNEEKKAENKRINEEKQAQEKFVFGSAKPLIQSDLSSFINKDKSINPKPIDPLINTYLENASSSPRTKHALISAPEEPTTITSAQIQEPPFVNVKPVVLMTPGGTKHELKKPKPPKNFKIIN